TLHDGVRAVDLGGDRANLLRVVRLVRLERDLRAALEVDAEVQAARAERGGACDDDRAGDRKPEIAPLHEVDLEPLRGLLALRAHEARVAEPAEAAEQAEQGAGRGDRGEQRDRR